MFNLLNATTWGLEVDDKFGVFKLPLFMPDFLAELEKIEKLEGAQRKRSFLWQLIDKMFASFSK